MYVSEVAILLETPLNMMRTISTLMQTTSIKTTNNKLIPLTVSIKNEFSRIYGRAVALAHIRRTCNVSSQRVPDN